MAVNKVIYNGNTLIDLSADTVSSAADIIQGKVGHLRDGSVVTGTASGGGGGGSASPKQINFIDYDGTIVESYTKTEWQSVTALPSNPSHSGLTAQGWNWTKAQIDAQLTAAPEGDVWVGQMYITDDGKTRVYIRLEKGRLHPYFGICPKGTVVVDWGDNSATATLTGTSLTTVETADHEYASAGDYVITLTVSSGTFAFYGVSNTSYILRKSSSSTAANVNKVYTSAVRKIELGSTARIGDYAFNFCQNLTSITMPSGVTSIGNNAFYNCYSLASITIPSGVTSISDNAVRACYSLTSITIPSRVTSISNSAFYGCYSLTSITIPSGVTSIGTSVFHNCYGMAEYHLLPTTPPTLSNTNAFQNIQSDCKIYVPSASLTTYKTASNWSAYASYMRGE